MSKLSKTDIEANASSRTIATEAGDHHADVHARRSGSASILVHNERGEVHVERRISGSDLSIAVKSRLSASSLPSIFPLPDGPSGSPVLGVNDAIKRSSGGSGSTGAYREHLYTIDALADKFKTGIDLKDAAKSKGLTSERATALLEELGPNVLTPPPRLPLWILFLLQFTNLFMVLLQVTALLCIILFIVDMSVWDNLYLGVLLYIAVIITCYETYSQEAKSDSLMEQFRAMVPEQASAIRDGQLKPMPVSDLVLGDIIRLKAGDKVPADCRVISASSMKVDQSMITGEAEPIDVEVNAADTNALEARNLIFNGSLVVDGSCYACVIKTGDGTLIGTMVELTGDVGKASSTLKTDIERFVKIVTLFALCQAALIFIVGLSRGYDPLTVFIYGFVVIMIGNVPQGLPTTVTASLFLVAERMGKQNVFVKKLDIIETLGACTLICTDKTGTLTMNQMTVSNLWLPLFLQQAADTDRGFNGPDFSSKVTATPSTTTSSSSLFMQLLSIATLNSRVVLEQKEGEATVQPTGDATELGLYRYFASILRQLPRAKDASPAAHDYDAIETYRAAHPKVHEIPFNSSFKWQMSIHRLEQQQQHMLMLKGAPDVLLDKCGFYVNEQGQTVPIDEAFRTRYQQVYEHFGGQGERVLGFAMRPYAPFGQEGSYDAQLARDPKYHEKLREGLIGKPSHHKAHAGEVVSEPVPRITDLVFVGLVTLLDPPRPEVPQAVRDCHTAHVKVVMVTGDHPLTAASIARKIGLLTKPATKEEVAKERGVDVSQVTDGDVPAVVVHGASIPNMTEADWAKLTAKEEIVFARTSPEQKLTIVKEFTKAGHITAMTGDGVNDSPALKQAAIGIAMGLNGSAVAKEAADVVLLDDNFASIVTGIREGRLLFANLKKSIAYTLAHWTPEVFPVLMWGFGGVVQPMGSMLALCVDLLTELVPATSFVYEDAESLIMKQPPRNPKTDKLTSFNLLFYSFFQSGVIIFCGCLFYYFRAFQHYGISPLQVMNNNNKFFPAESDDRVIISSHDGREYDSSEQKEILQSIFSGWYLMIVIGQVSHLFQCRTSYLSIFEHGVFRNKVSNFGAVLAVCLACFVVYCPGIRDVVSARNPVSLEILYASLLVSGAMWAYGEGRKYIIRTYPDSPITKVLAW